MTELFGNFKTIEWIDILSLFVITLSFIIFQRHILIQSSSSKFTKKAALSVANSLIYLSVLGLIIQPKLDWSAGQEDAKIILYTQSSNHVNSLIEQIAGDGSYILRDAVKETPLHLKEKVLLSPNQLWVKDSLDLVNVDLEILGDGLTQTQAKSLYTNRHIKSVTYTKPTKLKSGLVNPEWNKKINLGESSFFKARIQHYLTKASNQKAEQLSFKLLAPSGQILEEKTIDNNDLLEFRITPKVSGLLKYKITLFSGEQIISEELIPIEVTEQVKAKILILQSSPSFETKQFKNWASDQGATLVVSTNIAPKINSSRLTNVNQQNKAKYKNLLITDHILDEFDLLVVDLKRYQLLNTNQKASIKNSIENGLGVIFLVNSLNGDQVLPLSDLDSGQLRVSPQANKKAQNIFLISKNQEGTFRKGLVSNTPISISGKSLVFSKAKLAQINKNMTLLSTDINNNALVASIRYGLGRITYSLLQDTYRWVSIGEQKEHSQFWQILLKNTARANLSPMEWSDSDSFNGTASFLSMSQTRNEFCFFINLAQDKPVQASINSLTSHESIRVLLNKDYLLSDHYCTSFWPKDSGWYQLKVTHSQQNESLLNFYIHKKDGWLAHQQKEKIENTLKLQDYFVRSDTDIKTKDKIKAQSSRRPLSDWIYWLLIVMSLSFIWIENKFLDK
ncbi:MAG: hypothetical protein ACPGJI_02955 [Kangiellaceae bacterium]